MIYIIFAIPVYFIIALAIHSHYYIHTLVDSSYANRRAIFWPLYFVRWLVVNFILAVMGK
jgi:hypothetical protein